MLENGWISEIKVAFDDERIAQQIARAEDGRDVVRRFEIWIFDELHLRIRFFQRKKPFLLPAADNMDFVDARQSQTIEDCRDDGTPADRHHRLRQILRQRPQPRSHASCENDGSSWFVFVHSGTLLSFP